VKRSRASTQSCGSIALSCSTTWSKCSCAKSRISDPKPHFLPGAETSNHRAQPRDIDRTACFSRIPFSSLTDLAQGALIYKRMFGVGQQSFRRCSVRFRGCNDVHATGLRASCLAARLKARSTEALHPLPLSLGTILAEAPHT
jgi:hypothetical protein